MKKVLVSCAVLLAATLSPGRATHAPEYQRTVDTPTQVYFAPPIEIDAPTATPASTAKADASTTVSDDSSVPSVADAAVVPDAGGGSSTSVMQGDTATPEPPTCDGMSHSSSSSENGEVVRHRHTHSRCSDDSTADCNQPPCE